MEIVMEGFDAEMVRVIRDGRRSVRKEGSRIKVP
jgi:hypothetical protein